MIRIFILEDDEMITSGLKYALENEGYEVSHAPNVYIARGIIEKESFNMAIVDIQLPDGSGTEVGRLLKERQVPIIFLTVVENAYSDNQN